MMQHAIGAYAETTDRYYLIYDLINITDLK